MNDVGYYVLGEIVSIGAWVGFLLFAKYHYQKALVFIVMYFISWYLIIILSPKESFSDFYRRYSAPDAYSTQARVYPYSIGVLVDGLFEPIELHPPVENPDLQPLVKQYTTGYFAIHPGVYLKRTTLLDETYKKYMFDNGELVYISDRLYTGPAYNHTAVIARDSGVQNLVHDIQSMGQDAYMVTGMWTAALQVYIKHDGELRFFVGKRDFYIMGPYPKSYKRLEGHAFAVTLVKL
jgi:hypothetical protein